jgi:predicted SnoaL-like aldol condensation-catalyzing enzyme
LLDVYAENGVYLEALNPPHEGREMIRGYLDDFLSARPNIEITETRVIDGGDAVAVEWLLSYDQPNRRVTNLRRCSVLVVNDAGLVDYHRDYT